MVWKALTLLLVLFGTTSPVMFAQTGKMRTDTLRMQTQPQPRPAPSTNVALFLQHGYRTSLCNEDPLLILSLGAMLRGDIYTFPDGIKSIFIRLSAAGGFTSTLEAGAGIFLSRAFYLSAAYAFQLSPDCGSHNFGPHKTDKANNGILLAVGMGRTGLTVELNAYFFAEEVYSVRTIDGGFARDVKWPIAYAIRAGYSF